MAFPGARKYKLKRPIKASGIIGSLDFDGVYLIDHTVLPDAMLTLGGLYGLQSGGADLGISSDETGANRLSLQIVKCELDATPANSRVELWVRVPNIGTVSDTSVWLWWGDTEEVLPGASDPFGTYSVWNGTTNGSDVPISSHIIWHFNELVGNPTPQHLDSSGNGISITSYNCTNGDFKPGTGLIGTGTNGSIWISPGSWVPGTTNFSTIEWVRTDATSTSYYFAGRTQGVTSYYWVNGGFNNVLNLPTGTTAGANIFAAASRNAGTIEFFANTANNTTTGNAATSFNFNEIAVLSDYGPGAVGSTWLLSCGPNKYWLRALYDNVNSPTTFFDTTFEIQNAEITAVILFQGLNINSKVRIYEQPHPQGWSINFTGADYSSIVNDYFTCSVLNNNNTTFDYCYYFGTNPSLPNTDGYYIPSDGYTDTEIATAAEIIINSTNYIAASRNGKTITVYNDYNGTVTNPSYTGTEGIITLLQVGGTSYDEIGGVDNSIDDLVVSYSILKPRRALIQMIHLNYKAKRYSAILTLNGLVVPADALQVEDNVYSNPP